MSSHRAPVMGWVTAGILTVLTAGTAGSAAVEPGSAARAPASTPAGGPPWHIRGNLSEACSCNVPCTCNFGQGSTPAEMCWTLFSLDIRKGQYGKVSLAGMRLAAASGPRGFVYYVDDRATAAQAAALRDIANTIAATAARGHNARPPENAPLAPGVLAIQPASIVQYAGPTTNNVSIGADGGFQADYLIGMDGAPIRMENNWSFNIHNNIKAKTRRFRYHDRFGNRYDLAGTNSNQGTFDWADRTPVYFR